MYHYVLADTAHGVDKYATAAHVLLSVILLPEGTQKELEGLKRITCRLCDNLSMCFKSPRGVCGGLAKIR